MRHKMIKITTAHAANRNKNARKSFPISYRLPRLKFCRGKSVGQPPYVTAPSSVPSSEGLFYSIKKRRFLSTPASAGKHNPCFAWQLFFLCAPPKPRGTNPPATEPVREDESPLRQLRWLHPPFARGAGLYRSPVRRKPPLPKGGGPPLGGGGIPPPSSPEALG